MDGVAEILEELAVGAMPSPRGGWVVQVPTVRRGTVTVHVAESERTVGLRAFVLRGPDQGHEAVYRRLLAKNLEIRHWRLALDADGDIVAAADLDRAGLSPGTVDGLLGALSALVDEIYTGVLQAGFGVQTS